MHSHVQTRPARQWKLHPECFRWVCDRLWTPTMDLFATRFNNQLPVYVSPIPDQAALDVDALSIDWTGFDAALVLRARGFSSRSTDLRGMCHGPQRSYQDPASSYTRTGSHGQGVLAGGLEITISPSRLGSRTGFTEPLQRTLRTSGRGKHRGLDPHDRSLLAFATAARVSELHALDFNQARFERGGGGISAPRVTAQLGGQEPATRTTSTRVRHHSVSHTGAGGHGGQATLPCQGPKEVHRSHPLFH